MGREIKRVAANFDWEAPLVMKTVIDEEYPDEPYETPVYPEGEWWQVWENVSEGSPVTPAFATAEELIDYLCTHGDAWCQRRRADGVIGGTPPTREQATAFVMSGYAPSFSFSGGQMRDAYQTAGHVAGEVTDAG